MYRGWFEGAGHLENATKIVQVVEHDEHLHDATQNGHALLEVIALNHTLLQPIRHLRKKSSLMRDFLAATSAKTNYLRSHLENVSIIGFIIF